MWGVFVFHFHHFFSFWYIVVNSITANEDLEKFEDNKAGISSHVGVSSHVGICSHVGISSHVGICRTQMRNPIKRISIFM
jgi:hypothetical protein